VAFARPPNLLPYPYLSISERERRWAAIRAVIDGAQLDAVVVPPSDPALPRLHGDARWISQVGGIPDAPIAVVFPRVGEPIAIAQQAAQWLEWQPWLSDVREAASDFAAAVRVVLREFPLRGHRVGVARLGSPGQIHDDGPSDAFVSSLAASFPRIAWIGISDELDTLRWVKSAEEGAFLEHSAAMLEAAFLETAPTIRPGASDTQAWAQLIETMCRSGSDLPPPPRWTVSSRSVAMQREPCHQPLVLGDIVVADAEAVWGGYRAPGTQSYVCGTPTATDHALMETLATAWNAGLLALMPGMPLQDGERLIQEAVRRSTTHSTWATEIEWHLELRGCGLGGDVPRRAAAERPTRSFTLDPGCCLAYILSAGRGGRRFTWGTSIVVTRSGARPLTARQAAILFADHGDSMPR
jgi:Xaa-Pro aminopeptidase